MPHICIYMHAYIHVFAEEIAVSLTAVLFFLPRFRHQGIGIRV